MWGSLSRSFIFYLQYLKAASHKGPVSLMRKWYEVERTGDRDTAIKMRSIWLFTVSFYNFYGRKVLLASGSGESNCVFALIWRHYSGQEGCGLKNTKKFTKSSLELELINTESLCLLASGGQAGERERERWFCSLQNVNITANSKNAPLASLIFIISFNDSLCPQLYMLLISSDNNPDLCQSRYLLSSAVSTGWAVIIMFILWDKLNISPRPGLSCRLESVSR